MGKQARTKHEPKRTSPANVAPAPGPNLALLALSLLGAALAAYLTWTDVTGSGVKGCAVGSACDVVLTSRWATLLGMPTAQWGLLAYLALAGIAFLRPVERRWRWAWIVALFGVLYSAYLTTISLTVLGAACPYCLTSLALMATIFALVTAQRPATLPAFSWQRWLTRTVPVAAAAIVALHLNYTGVLGEPPSVEDPTSRALAIHLRERGARMYGAQWCAHCIEQKEMFGAAARRLPYIECAAGGQGSQQAAPCRAERITTYPTWIIDGKRYEEVLTTTRLAELTGFQAPSVPGS